VRLGRSQLEHRWTEPLESGDNVLAAKSSIEERKLKCLGRMSRHTLTFYLEMGRKPMHQSVRRCSHALALFEYTSLFFVACGVATTG
jgi:hypothetical protein